MVVSEHCCEEPLSKQDYSEVSTGLGGGRRRGRDCHLLTCLLFCSRNDGAASWYETTHGPSYGDATRPWLTNGDATSRNEAATTWHER